MKIFGLQDGPRPGHLLDRWPETIGARRINWDVDPAIPDGGAGGGGSTTPPVGETPPPAAPADPPVPDPDISLDGDLDQAKVKELIEDRRRKNRLLLEEKKRADELAAENAKYKKAEEDRQKASMSEIDRANAEAAEAKARLETVLADKERIERETVALKAGIDPMLIAPVGLELLSKKIDTADEKAVKEYFEQLKTDRPKWFADAPEPAPGAAGGHQRQGSQTLEQKIAALEEQKKQAISERQSRGQIAAIDSKIEVLRLGINKD